MIIPEAYVMNRVNLFLKQLIALYYSGKTSFLINMKATTNARSRPAKRKRGSC